MGKKAVLFIVIGIVLGIGGALAGVFFMLNQTNKPQKEVNEFMVEEFDLKNGKSLTLEKVQIPLVQTGSKTQFLQADFTIVFKDEKALTQAEGMKDYIKDAIMSVFEVKTADELKQTGARNDMKEPVLNAVRELFNDEADRENIVAVMIPTFIVT